MTWSNVASSVLTANTVIVVAGAPNTGLFVYAGTPTLGNLRASITAQTGTDPYGNHYAEGVTSYRLFFTNDTTMREGTYYMGDAGTDFTNAAQMFQSLTFGGDIQFNTGVGLPLGNFVDAVRAAFTAGRSSQATGSATAPNFSMIDGDLTSAVDLLLSGSVIKTDITGTPVTWQTPAFAAGWADGTGIGGNFPALKWRLDAENNVHVHGTFHATVAAPATTIATGLPAVNLYSGGGNVGIIGTAHYVLNNTYALPLYIDTSGRIIATVAAAFPGVNATFIINGKVPIGNLP